ncbi:hypothetical protein SAMN04487996_118192 [Dyadobacter soli]|uniref:Uncharacterized protein n=1 Tax=Dyadobacter soli TaxID=659014 RepID=A0A1G7UAE0_9BACT|nr:hypothetical protein [Dyadobacter soli]SDG43730.1 hypothetical protein SAMN04487996_118192 [Dyadobacter soli]
MNNNRAYKWLTEKLSDKENFSSVKIDDCGIMNISRIEGPKLRLIGSSLEIFTLNDVVNLADLDHIDFILHVHKDPFIYGEVFEYLDSKRKVVGGYGDVFRIVERHHNWPYLPKDVQFIKRGLEQHDKVKNVRRLDTKRYEVSRYGLETVTIVAVDDYDIVAESIRSTLDKYKKFDAVFKANPYGKISSSAYNLARNLNIKVLRWSELLGQLNNKWN